MPPVVTAEAIHQPTGRLTNWRGRDCYQIEGIEAMEPFLVNVVSSTDLWMFASSTGAVTAGRKDANRALFPYLTEDRLHRLTGSQGPVTLLRNRGQYWQPFHPYPDYSSGRTLIKSLEGDCLLYAEIHQDWNLTWQMSWSPSAKFGWVREVELSNHGDQTLELEIMDGLVDLMPSGVDTYSEMLWSNLADAYKRAETGPWGTAAVYNLEALITDRAEPAESLTATLVWSTGLDQAKILLDERALVEFRRGQEHRFQPRSTGRPGSYLLASRLMIPPGEKAQWMMVADPGLDHGTLADRLVLAQSAEAQAEVKADITLGQNRWRQLLASADGYTQTGEPVMDAHHLSNVTFNTLRGGLFPYSDQVPISDLIAFLRVRNRDTTNRHQEWLEKLGDWVSRPQLLGLVEVRTDPTLTRLVGEYLPLTLSRRHGDPSRPWNRFSIRTHTDSGQELLTYEGNWRDIFQNWEALGRSFPGYLSAMVFTFVNTSTLDGHNPYRITRDGIDWEVPDPDDPWANIGYWGDHQIVYLSRLLEAWQQHFPDQILEFINQPIFVYADVPYRIAVYQQLIKNPRESITYDWERDQEISERVSRLGADGKLVVDEEGEIHRVGLLEKLFVPVLSKLTALVPDGGIWMYTQRPEWNDANNALAGFGLSMVTVFYLRRYLDQLEALVEQLSDTDLGWSQAIWSWWQAIGKVMTDHLAGGSSSPSVSGEHMLLTPKERRVWLDAMGRVGSETRARLYQQPDLFPQTITTTELLDWLDKAKAVLDQTIRSSARSDGLFHSYNLISFPNPDQAEVHPLSLMLEGQVAAISAGHLKAEQIADLVDQMFESPLYTARTNSFMLYPPRDLPPFIAKNQVVIPPELEVDDELAQLFSNSTEGKYYFSPDLVNADVLRSRMQELGINEETQAQLAELYEGTFSHHSFTGRSGSMYGFEGIGSIYWHMVSKLLLAVGEAFAASQTSDRPDGSRRLREAYHRIRDGHGMAKTVEEWGSFPTDCYSHTPAHSGAQQPGMTGQVKELILARWLELGVRVEAGGLVWQPGLLAPELFQADIDRSNTARFSYCGTEFQVLSGAEPASTTICFENGQTITRAGWQLLPEEAEQLFERNRQIQHISFRGGEQQKPAG